MYRPLKVQKFGGTSVGSEDRLRIVSSLIKSEASANRLVVVVSAPNGITDLLVHTVDRPPNGRVDVRGTIQQVRERYMRLALHCLEGRFLADFVSGFERRIKHLEQLLALVDSDGLTGGRRDEIISEGERIAAPLMAALVRQDGIDALAVNAAELIRTDSTFGEANVDFDESRHLTRAWLEALGEGVVPIITGFIGSDAHGNVTTLGRGGSDYSAAIIAGLLDADLVERWTDVDGIYTGDPNKNADARRFARIKLHEANLWNQAGRLGMHPRALEPLVHAGIPLHVRSTFHPDAGGTLIVPEALEVSSASYGT